MNEPPAASAVSPKPADDSRSWLIGCWRRFHHWVRPPPNADDLREVVEELIEEPLSTSGISEGERMLLGNIMTLRGRKVGDCMVPRADIIAIDIAADLKELVDLMAAHAHSRIPVYRDTLDDAIGMVHMKDLMPCLAYGQQRKIADLLRPVLFVAPSMAAAKLLLQMRQTRQHMAMVVDEFGGVDGVVTIEDLVEEVVGEIEDEHDTVAAPPIVTRADGTLLVDARMTTDEFVAMTGIILPPLDVDAVDTLGGYVTHLAGRLPQIGEKIAGGILGFEVLEMDQGRIRRLRVRPQPGAQAQPLQPVALPQDTVTTGAGAKARAG